MGAIKKLDISDDLRKKIMDTAVTIVEEDGYESLSLKRISHELGVTLGTIQLYYKSKHKIISDMADGLYYKIMLTGVTLVKDPQYHTAKQKLRAMILMTIRGFIDDPEVTKTIMYSGVNEMFAAREGHSAPSNLGMERINELIDQGIFTGEFKTCASGTAWMLLSSVLGFVLSCLESKIYQSQRFHTVAGSYVDLLIGGLIA